MRSGVEAITIQIYFNNKKQRDDTFRLRCDSYRYFTFNRK